MVLHLGDTNATFLDNLVSVGFIQCSEDELYQIYMSVK